MEPQTDIPNPPELNQAEPPKDKFRSIITSPRYWMAALLPLLGVYLGMNIKHGIFIWPVFIPGIFTWQVFVLPLAISFGTNFILPFTINIRRALYLFPPPLILFIFYLVDAFIRDSNSDLHGDVMNSDFLFSLCAIGPYFMVLLFLWIGIGWLGAKAGIARGRKA